MRICNLSDGLGQLSQAIADLDQQWELTRAHWNDQASREFDETHLQPLPSQMQLLMSAVQALATTADKAVNELEDHGEM